MKFPNKELSGIFPKDKRERERVYDNIFKFLNRSSLEPKDKIFVLNMVRHKIKEEYYQ